MKQVHGCVVGEVGRRSARAFGGRLRRAAWLVPLLLLLVVTAKARADVATPYFILPPGTTNDRMLELGNGNKIVVGAAKSLHAVYVRAGIVYYARSANGVTWSNPEEISSGRQPSIAVDSLGGVGVAWVDAPAASGFGTLVYAYRNSAGDWSYKSISAANAAREPALISHGNAMHLTWAEPRKLYYTTFPSTYYVNDPNAGVTRELIASTSCASGAFRSPSLAMVRGAAMCDSPKIAMAYLAYGIAPGCISSVGPVVRRREATNVWSQLFGTIQNGTGWGATEAFSLSFASNLATGHMFLAWSSRFLDVASTKLARGLESTWTPPIQLSATPRHVHLRTDPSATPSPQLRLAWTEAGSGSDPFLSTSTYVDTATWDGASPIWLSSTLLGTMGAGRPQAVFWQRCMMVGSVAMLAESRAFFEALNSDGLTRRLATTLTVTAGCPPIPPVGEDPCDEVPGPVPQ